MDSTTVIVLAVQGDRARQNMIEQYFAPDVSRQHLHERVRDSGVDPLKAIQRNLPARAGCDDFVSS